MSNSNLLKHANVTIVSSTEEQGRELLKIIESMMMDYINYREDDTENNDGFREKLTKDKEKNN